MRISGMRRRRLRTASMVAAAFAAMMALTGVSLTTRLRGYHVGRCGQVDDVPGGSLAADPGRRLQLASTVRHHVDGHPGRRDQARVADHSREQVLRRDLHGPQPEQLPVADAPATGCTAHELLRHRALQHGQLHLLGFRPVPLLRRTGRLLDHREHDEQQHRGSSRRARSARAPTPTAPPTFRGPTRLRPIRRRAATATTASSWSTAGSTPRWVTTAACTRPTWRPCSTSSTRPVSRGRRTPRTSAGPSRRAPPPT